MSLLFRWFLTIFLSRFRPSVPLMGEVRTPLRVFPHDLDLLFHVNNGRYFTYLDIGRIDWLFRTGQHKRIREKNWYPVAVAATLRFRKSLTVFQRFETSTKLLGWDDRDFYIEHRIYRSKDLITYGMMRARFLKKEGGQVSTEEFMRALGYDPKSPDLPASAVDWRNSERVELSH